MFHSSPSEKGKERLLHEGYLYYRVRKDRESWICAKRKLMETAKSAAGKPKCTATLTVDTKSLAINPKGEHLEECREFSKKEITELNDRMRARIEEMRNTVEEFAEEERSDPTFVSRRFVWRKALLESPNAAPLLAQQKPNVSVAQPSPPNQQQQKHPQQPIFPDQQAVPSQPGGNSVLASASVQNQNHLLAGIAGPLSPPWSWGSFAASVATTSSPASWLSGWQNLTSPSSWLSSPLSQQQQQQQTGNDVQLGQAPAWTACPMLLDGQSSDWVYVSTPSLNSQFSSETASQSDASSSSNETAMVPRNKSILDTSVFDELLESIREHVELDLLIAAYQKKGNKLLFSDWLIQIFKDIPVTVVGDRETPLPELDEILENQMRVLSPPLSALPQIADRPIERPLSAEDETFLRNLRSERLFRDDLNTLLDQLDATDLERKAIRFIERRMNPGFLALQPYERRCDCRAKCTSERDIVHAISNFLVHLGHIAPVLYDDADADQLFREGRICRYGRFRDPMAFRRRYFYREINMSADLLRGYDCECGKVFPGNAVHFLCKWMLVNGLVAEEDFDAYIRPRLPRVHRCKRGRLTWSWAMKDFFANCGKFARCADGEPLADGELYFTYCLRTKPDMQASVVCQTRDRIVAGSTLFLGMDYREHYRYVGDPAVTQRIIANLPEIPS